MMTMKRALHVQPGTLLFLLLLLSSWIHRPCQARMMELRRFLHVQSYSSSSKKEEEARGELEAKEYVSHYVSLLLHELCLIFTLF